jgi:dynein heavy chain
MVAEANYGGRVTDYWDLRCIRTILQDFYTPLILQAKYSLSASGVYTIPQDVGPLVDYIDYIKYALP